MPRRSNLFQQVVAIVYEHLADDAAVEESALIPDLQTGQDREVDVLIRGRIAGEEIIVAVEAVARSRKADVTWVESMLSKHQALPTNKLILVSEKGFSEGAARKASAFGVVPIVPESLSESDGVGEIVNRLQSVRARVRSLVVSYVEVALETSGGRTLAARPQPEIPFYSPKGEKQGTFSDLMDVFARGDLMAKGVELDDVEDDFEENGSLTYDFPMVIIGDDPLASPIYLDVSSDDAAQSLLPVKRMKIHGTLTISIHEIPLSHQRIGATSTAFGTGKLAGSSALLVMTEGQHGSKATIRLADGRQAQLQPHRKESGWENDS
jgi:hypothetical protein